MSLEIIIFSFFQFLKIENLKLKIVYPMPIKKSAKKYMRVTKRKTEKNKRSLRNSFDFTWCIRLGERPSVEGR